MNTSTFCALFDRFFPPQERDAPTPGFEQAFVRSFFDPCFLVQGMTSVKNQHVMRLAFSCLPESECYFEIGTLQGKILVSVLVNNPPRKAYACDNFCEFTDSAERSAQVLRNNLRMFGVEDRVTFYNADFRGIMDREHVPEPVGLYLYDAMHTAEMQYDGIRLAEPLLADEALVVVDDWNWGEAVEGTNRAIAESRHEWTLLYELRNDGESNLAKWWNGLGIFRFRRRG
ncbi:MAG TPA: class I SAM-dependent methyltransferase [Candidatus Hydrogenedentes bacterium]|nr:class I SAM-dependent methyltransferase [Candidatus Hydrogenedentota bacterium]